MVIISWNMAKSTNIPFEQVLKLCENWGASVVVVQEPTGSLISFGSRHRTVQPRGCESSWTGWLQRGGSQGSIVILAREGVSIGGVNAVNLGTGQGINIRRWDRPALKVADRHSTRYLSQTNRRNT